jgi:hypothetical protein
MKDKCIICNKETKYDDSQHIEERYGYIEGAGQLCMNCYISKDVVMNILIQMVLRNPNDMQLGEKVRTFYNSKLKK